MNYRFIRLLFSCLLVAPIILSGISLAGDEQLIADIEALVSAGPDAPNSQWEAIRDRIEKNPSAVTKAAPAKIKAGNLDEKTLAAYIWALGFTRDSSCVDAIIEQARKTDSMLVRGNCWRALAEIGDHAAGAYLCSSFKEATDGETRYSILNLLAQMQYEPALEFSDEILKKDPEQYYWQSIFIFGKMGDKAVPFLLTKISAEDRNTRFNAINALGRWLIPAQAAQPLRERYWKEEDSEIRNLILSSLETVAPDFKSVESFSKEVVLKEKDEALQRFAKETIENLPEMSEGLKSFEAKKRSAPEDFQREYQRIFASFGLKGDYEVIAATASFEDEAKLKKLRERVLQRNSDESYYDFQKINRIIHSNRLLNTQK